MIPLSLLILISLTIWFLALTKGHYIVKVILTPLVLVSTLGVWYSMESLLGWPSPQQLPEKYQLHWVVINEPSDSDEGAIYLLVSSVSRRHENVYIGGHKANTKEPRLYKISYSRKGHEQAEELKKSLKQGKTILLSREKGKSKGKGIKGKDKGKKGDLGGEGNQDQDSPFGYLLPPPKLPSK